MTASGPSRRPVLASIAVVLMVTVGLAGCAKGQGSTEAFCAHLRKLSNRTVLLGRFDPSNASEVRVYKRSAATEMSQLERAAPREIKPDVAAVADLTAEVAQLAEKYHNDQGELQYRLYNLARQRLGAAGSVVKVTGFAKSKCGIDLNASRNRNRQHGSFDSGDSFGSTDSTFGPPVSSDTYTDTASS